MRRPQNHQSGGSQREINRFFFSEIFFFENRI
jgi:hypothetical protein